MSEEKKLGYLNIDSSLYQTRISKKFENRKPYAPVNHKLIVSYIPGTVVDVFVTPGDEVKKGDVVAILDAMKMQNKLKSSVDGRVKSISAVKGSKVAKGTVLIELE